MGKTQDPKTSASQRSCSPSLEELIKEQGVVPADDLDEIGALWPADDDLESFERFVAEERARRRSAHG